MGMGLSSIYVGVIVGVRPLENSVRAIVVKVTESKGGCP